MLCLYHFSNGSFICFDIILVLGESNPLKNIPYNCIKYVSKRSFSYLKYNISLCFSGKTYTMVGTEGDPGLMVLSLHTIFDFIKNDKSSDVFEVTCSYLEVYNEVFTCSYLILKSLTLYSLCSFIKRVQRCDIPWYENR